MKEKEVKKLLISFSSKFEFDTERFFGAKPRIELAETQVADILIVNGKPLLARSNGILYPTLILDGLPAFLPKIVVDMGAVSHVCNGADVMAPGVVHIKGNFDEKDLLLIMDERYKKSLAIGISLFNSKTMKTLKRGKIAKNIHYVGDKLWNIIKSFA